MDEKRTDKTLFQPQGIPRRLIAVFIFLAIGIITVGYIFFRSEKTNIVEETYEGLSLISDLKVDQIANWRGERKSDARAMSANPYLVTAIKRWIADRTPAFREELSAWLVSIHKIKDYSNIFILDAEGNPLLQAAEEKMALSGDERELVENAKMSRGTMISDLHRSNEGNVHIDIVVPLVSSESPTPVGYLMYRIDPARFIFPLIQSWPTKSRTAETLLVRREGDEVVYLNELRHKKGTVLNFRLPIDQKNLPAAMGALGKEGTVEGVDYRGIKVFAAVKKVPDSNWALVAKIDVGEVYTSLYGRAAVVTVAVLGLIAAATLGVLSLWRRREIVERRHAEEALRESEGRLNLAQEIAHLGSWELDVVGNRLKWSDEVYRIFGLKPQEFAATYEAFLEAVHPDDRKALDEAYSGSLREGRDSYEIEHRIVRKATGEIRFVHEKCEHIRDDYGRIIRSIGMVHDITERKEAEHELMKFYEELERRVQQRTDELLVVKRLSDIGTLAATVAHELRNPLGVIQLAIENMRRKKIDEETEKHLSRIEKKVSESNLIIDNLSFYSRIRQPHFENVQPHKILEECIGMAQSTYKEKNVSVETNFDPIRDTLMEADSIQLKEIFNNIIANAYQALKDEGGKIELRASKGDDDFITIVVKDNGVGIPKEDLEKVHEPFYSTKSKGTGLGLTICQELVGMHNGRIEIASDVGAGTTVTVCLPVNRSAQCEIISS